MNRRWLIAALVAAVGAACPTRDGQAAPFAAPPAPALPRVAVFAVTARARAQAPAPPETAFGAADPDPGPWLGELLNRLRLELAAAGLPAPDGAHPPDYVVAIVRDGDGDPLVVEVRRTRFDVAAPSVSARRTRLAATAEGDAASVAAIRAVEFLRAAILQDEAAAAEARVPPAHAAIAGAGAPPPTRTGPSAPIRSGLPFAAGFGLTAFQSFRGLNTGFGLGGRVDFELRGPLSFRFMSVGPAFARDQQTGSGAVSLMQLAAGVGVSYALGHHGKVRPSLSLMGGVYWSVLSLSGQPMIPDSSRNDVVPFGSVGVGLPVVSWGSSSSIRLQVDALFTPTARSVTVSGEEVGRLGSPVVLIGVSVDRAAIFVLDGGR